MRDALPPNNCYFLATLRATCCRRLTDSGETCVCHQRFLARILKTESGTQRREYVPSMSYEPNVYPNIRGFIHSTGFFMASALLGVPCYSNQKGWRDIWANDLGVTSLAHLDKLFLS